MNTLNKMVLVSGLLFAQNSFAQKAPQTIINKSDVSRIIKTLSADEMMGRSALKPNEIGKVANFISSEFKKAGLKYFKGATSYRQNFSISNVEPLSSSLMINGKSISKDAFFVSSAKQNLKMTTLLQILKVEKGDNFSAKYRQAISGKQDVLVCVDESFKANFNRLKGFLGRGTMVAPDQKATPSVVFLLSNEVPTSINLDFTNKITEIPMFNVVGVLPGKSKPNEYVVFSGHYDHLGVIKATNQDSIANGADDDASGTTAVIELAKYFAAKKNNQRTLIFVAFTAEEIGGYGSQYFSKQLDPAKTVAMFNIEMIGKESKFGKNNAFITGYERSDFGKILQKNLEGTSFKFYPDPYPEQNLFYRSDNATLARLGVPAHTISSDQIDTDKLYHSVDDEFESMDIGNITEIIKAIALSSTSIVNGADTPSRISGVE
ncbi:M20/M25/M40 family metallo-hydrolase [Pelobium sp.]|nr:M20/M25/M40 family metallo-hydrolase [Pelobium sp.]MDA9554719.1 M20/M25/M40 family metallo-hydrolase [Pelobium sp.]